MRRFLDIIFSLLLIILTIPLWVVIIILILIFSPGPIFFMHTRVGQYGREFSIIKFRSMQVKNKGLDITVSGDRRITGIGKFLRKFKLDELPQFLNILKGDMTFVGPRPEAVEYVKKYDSKQLRILQYKPGLVDPGTLKFKNEEKILAQYDNPHQTYLEKIMPEKIQISLDYQKKRTLLTDFGIILRTLALIFKSR